MSNISFNANKIHELVDETDKLGDYDSIYSTEPNSPTNSNSNINIEIPAEKNEQVEQNENIRVIEIKNSDNHIEFFLKANGHLPELYKVDKNTKIGDIIEKYINSINGKKELKNNFYFRDQLIDNLDRTIFDLGITSLGFVVCKY